MKTFFWCRRQRDKVASLESAFLPFTNFKLPNHMVSPPNDM